VCWHNKLNCLELLAELDLEETRLNLDQVVDAVATTFFLSCHVSGALEDIGIQTESVEDFPYFSVYDWQVLLRSG
jgi:hypothetical protein